MANGKIKQIWKAIKIATVNIKDEIAEINVDHYRNIYIYIFNMLMVLCQIIELKGNYCLRYFAVYSS